MELSVIIVNYNVKYFLEQALLSVMQAIVGIEAEVFVVDNNSSDGSVEMVIEKFPEVHLIANKENVGFSKANNQAIRRSEGKYVLLLNPDTVVEEDTFRKCLDFMEQHPDAGGLGVKMIDGSGKFLPESKRGFPTPFVAFCKTFGLSTLFPRSPIFNRYHMGFLDEDETNEVDILSGAFMWMRAEALEKSGLLDEAFFMYGEDIDLSYRLQKAGYKNYYFAETKIIHYKGESTKKGSLNYVRTFYQAMVIFARKHFSGNQAGLYVLFLRFGIYFRATITLLLNWTKGLSIPITDGLILWVGLHFLKRFWGSYKFNDPLAYEQPVMYFNIVLYIAVWLLGIYFSGGYDKVFDLRRVIRGLLAATLVIAAIYGFLDLSYRTSRVLILLGTFWGILSISSFRTLVYFFLYKNLSLGKESKKNLVIVGTEEESRRVLGLLHDAQVKHLNLIGTVAPPGVINEDAYLSDLDSIDDVVHIYKVEEIIFCSKDIRTQDILNWMTRLGPEIAYRIVPPKSLSIIGSTSKNTSGELYTIEVRFQIQDTLNRRNKRLLDILLSIWFLLTFPFSMLFVKGKAGFFRNILAVIRGGKTWVGFAEVENQQNLPDLSDGVLSPLDGLRVSNLNNATKHRLNFLYAKDYRTIDDIQILWEGFRHLGRS